MQISHFKVFSELNVLQLREKIIPEFERLHGPEYQALIMVDNSQGHAAYAEDALLTSKMNLNPGGAVPKLRDSWFMRDGCRITQPMVFPADHPTSDAGKPKGIKQVLLERGLWRKWEHRMIRWMEAYRDAQFEVKKYGSQQYKLHC
jgi:hypothetical protein